ncbi:MAG: tetratricopeptide repeat protein [Salinispira sp.]
MNKKIIPGALLITAGIIIAIVFFAMSANNAPSRVENILTLAKDYIEQAEYDRALDLLEDILIDDPENENAIDLRNVALEQKRGGEVHSENVIADDIADVDGTDDSSEQREFSDPVDANEGRRAADREVQAQIETQKRAEEQRRREDARLAALTAEEAAIQRQVYTLLEEARQLQEVRDFTSARDKIQQAIGLNEDFALPYSRLAETYLEEDIENAENRRRAAELAEIAIGKDSDLWEPYNVLGSIFHASKLYDRAIQSFSIAADLEGASDEVLYALGNAQFDARQFSAARKSYESYISRNSDNVNAFFNLGLTFERLNLYSPAIENYQRALGVQSNYAPAYNRIGELSLLQGDSDAALSNLRQALIHDNNARNNRAIARVFYERGEYEHALDFFLTVLAFEPNRAQNQYNIATVLLDLNRSDEALRFAEDAVRLDSSVPEYNYTLGLALKAVDNLEQSQSFFLVAIAQQNSYIKPRIEVAEIFIIKENYDAALQELLIAFRLDSSRSDVNNNLATIYRLKGNYDKSLEHSSLAIRAEPDSAPIRYNSVLTLIKMQRFAEAESSLRQTIGIDDMYFDAYIRLGEVLIAQGKNDKGMRILNDLIQRAIDSEQAREAMNIINSL